MTNSFSTFFSIFAGVALLACPGVVQSNISTNISTEDGLGIPFLRGEGHHRYSGDGAVSPGVYIIIVAQVRSVNLDLSLGFETPVSVRRAWYEQVVFWQAVAATKLKNPTAPGIGMLDRFRKADGSFGLPDYKLSDAELQFLYSNPFELDRYRATVVLTAWKRWMEVIEPKELFDGPMYQARERFFEEIKTLAGDEFGAQPFTVDVDTDDTSSFGCAGEPCLPITAPQALGRRIAQQVLEHDCGDGWNACGSLDGEPGAFGPDMFADTTGYHPVHEAGVWGDRTRWAPLQECDGRGYCCKQLHVTPHIGFTANTEYLSASDRQAIYDQFQLQDDDQDSLDSAQARAVLARTRALASDEQEKTLVAFFDNKVRLANAAFHPAQEGLGWKIEDYLYYEGYTSIWYDGVIVNWGTKVLNDRVRPTTVMQELLGDEQISNWAEGIEGEKSYPARKWNAYVRVMPHSEYPSGSSCLCTGFAKWVAQALRLPDWAALFPISIRHKAGSNAFEPRLPTEEFVAHYSSWKQLADKCGETRLNGGMHFNRSVPPGRDMCGGDKVMDKGVAFIKYLWTGSDAFLEPHGGVASFGHSPDKSFKRPPPRGNPMNDLDRNFLGGRGCQQSAARRLTAGWVVMVAAAAVGLLAVMLIPFTGPSMSSAAHKPTRE